MDLKLASVIHLEANALSKSNQRFCSTLAHLFLGQTADINTMIYLGRGRKHKKLNQLDKKNAILKLYLLQEEKVAVMLYYMSKKSCSYGESLIKMDKTL